MTRYLKLPPRVQQVIIDSETGSYPTISRLSSDSRTGRFGSTFDDRRTIIFSTGVQVNLPTLLPSGSLALFGISSSLNATGTVRRGIADGIFTYASGQPFVPFDETKSIRSFGTELDPFHLTGSWLDDVGDGLLSPTWSKTALTVRLDVADETTLRMSSSAGLDLTTRNNYPMAYYNVVDRKWDPVGRGIGFIIDVPTAHGTGVNAINNMLGFSPSYFGAVGASDWENVSQSCVPFDHYGFPLHGKFHATSSQQFDVASLIDRPFLLEKIVYEFTASFSGAATFRFDDEINHCTFFVLNQRRPFQMPTIHPSDVLQGTNAHTTWSLPSTMQLSDGGPFTFVDSQRDLVTWMQVASHGRTLNTAAPDYRRYARRELNIIDTSTTADWSGSMVMSGAMKVPAVQQLLNTFNSDNDFIEMAVAYLFGGRSNRGRTSGRDYSRCVVANNITDRVSVDAIRAQFLSGTSPYLLLPGDKLVFGWQLPWPSEMIAANNADLPSLRLLPGHGKLTLIGSQLRDNVEFHDTLNQGLTTPSVHEDIHDDNPVLDQFETEDVSQYSGTMTAEFVTGSMSTTLDGRGVVFQTFNVTKDIRHATVIGQVLLQRNEVPGFQRTIQHVSEHEQYFDSFVPSPEDITTLNGAQIYASAYQGSSDSNANVSVVVLGFNSSGGTGSLANVTTDVTWNRAFPYEPRYASLKRLRAKPRARSTAAAPIMGGNASLGDHVFGVAQCLTLPEAGLHTVRYIALCQTAGFASQGPSPFRYAMTHYYGFGDADSGSTGFRSSTVYLDGQANGSGSLHRGWKYGIINAFEYKSRTHWRRSHYGYFRDMLEQRLDSKMFDNVGLNADGTISGRIGALSSPVTARFVQPRSTSLTQPTRTWSSNLSIEATSSLPYFDGVVRNREEPLSSSNINSSSA